LSHKTKIILAKKGYWF